MKNFENNLNTALNMLNGSQDRVFCVSKGPKTGSTSKVMISKNIDNNSKKFAQSQQFTMFTNPLIYRCIVL